MHALSGYDTTSYFFVKVKVYFIKAIQETNTASALSRLTAYIKNEVTETTIEETVHVATVIVSHMYLKIEEDYLNTVRANVYYSGKKSRKYPANR